MDPASDQKDKTESAEKKSKNKPRRHKAAKSDRQAAAEALILELKTLRTVLNESVAQFELKQSARIAEIVRQLEGDSATGEKPLVLKGKQREVILMRLRQTKFKPKKGRLKDLVALHDLVDALEESLIPSRDGGNL